MTTLINAARQALKALVAASGHVNNEVFVKVMMARDSLNNALRQAIEQQEKQEPVAWISPSGNLYRTRYLAVANGEQAVTPLYATPHPQGKP